MPFIRDPRQGKKPQSALAAKYESLAPPLNETLYPPGKETDALKETLRRSEAINPSNWPGLLLAGLGDVMERGDPGGMASGAMMPMMALGPVAAAESGVVGGRLGRAVEAPMLGANAGAMAEKAMPKLQRVNQAKEAVMGKAGMPSPNYGMGQEMQGFHQQPKAMPMAELTNPGNLGEPLRAESLLADDYQIGPKPTMTPEEKKGLIAALITLLSGTAAGASAGRYASRQKPVQIQAQNQAVPAPRAKVRLPDEDLRGKGVEEP